MTKSEYADYLRRMETAALWVVRFDPVDPEADRLFSWSPCDICDRPNMAGMRSECDWSSTNRGTDIPLYLYGSSTVMVCDDCIYFQEYGQLDDLTMMEMGG